MHSSVTDTLREIIHTYKIPPRKANFDRCGRARAQFKSSAVRYVKQTRYTHHTFDYDYHIYVVGLILRMLLLEHTACTWHRLLDDNSHGANSRFSRMSSGVATGGAAGVGGARLYRRRRRAGCCCCWLVPTGLYVGCVYSELVPLFWASVGRPLFRARGTSFRQFLFVVILLEFSTQTPSSCQNQ